MDSNSTIKSGFRLRPGLVVAIVAVDTEPVALPVASTGAPARLRGAISLTGNMQQRHERVAAGKTKAGRFHGPLQFGLRRGAAEAFRCLRKGATLNFYPRAGANMSTDGKISPSIADAVQLARVRMDEMFRRVGASLPSDVRRELSAGVEAILVDVLSRHPAWRHDADDFLSISEAAALLFVARPHISKLLEQGKLELHHEKGNDRFVTKVSVLKYWATREAAVEAYNASTSDEE